MAEELTFRDIQLNYKSLFATKRDSRPPIKGELTEVGGDVIVEGRDQYVWFTPIGASNPVQILNRSVVPRNGLPVLVGFFEEGSKEVEILDVDMSFADSISNLAANKIVPHATEHQPGGGDMLWVDPRQLLEFAVYPAGGLFISIAPGYYRYGNSTVRFPGLTGIDISGSQPLATEHIAVGVYINLVTNTASTVDGAAVLLGVSLTEPTWPTNSLPIAIIDLDGSQTTISFASDIISVKGSLSDNIWSRNTDGDAYYEGEVGVGPGVGTAMVGEDHQLALLMAADKDIEIDGSTNPRTIDTGIMRFEQKPAITDVRAVTINIDANSQPNTHAIVVNMLATGLAVGETLSGYDTIIDSADASGGHVHAYEVSVAGSGVLDEVEALHINPGVKAIHQESGVFGNVEQAWVNDSGWTDVTVAFNATGTDVEIFSNDNAEVYWGMAAVFNAIEVNLATVASGGPGIKPVFEFSDGVGGWTVFTPVDESQGFRQIGIIDWETLVGLGWATDTVNGVANKYWIRITRTANSLTTPPIEDTLKVATVAEYTWNDTGDLDVATVTIEDFLYHAGDPNTYLQFTEDQAGIFAGGIEMFRADETTQDILYLGDVDGGGDVDIDLNNGQAFLRGSDGRLGIGTVAPDAPLDVNGNFLMSGGSQSYLFRDRADGLAVQSQTSGVTSAIEFFSADGDGTDSVAYSIFGVGTPAASANRERLQLRYQPSGPQYEIRTEAQGTGTLRPLILSTEGNTDQLFIAVDGNIGLGVSPSTRLDIDAGAMEFAEMTAPGAGAANTGRVYFEDNGAGKTRMMVIFATGAAQQVAIQP